jgi:hypothetical protein
MDFSSPSGMRFFLGQEYTMSSVVASFKQVPARGGHLLAVSDNDSIVFVDATVTYLMTTTAWAAAIEDGLPIDIGNLYRDMGKTVTVYNPVTNLAVERWAKVMLVNGPASEGVATSPVVGYVKVWTAAGTGVDVARV